jgi:phosphatidylinositol glycan class S
MAETTADPVLAEEAVANYDGTGSGRKQPPPEKPADIRRRTLVIVSFWLIVLCLGLPIWWQTTTIHRANLPLDEMLHWADGRVSLDLTRVASS